MRDDLYRLDYPSAHLSFEHWFYFHCGISFPAKTNKKNQQKRFQSNDKRISIFPGINVVTGMPSKITVPALGGRRAGHRGGRAPDRTTVP